MAEIEYALDASVAVVALNDGENRFNPGFINKFLNVLDEVEQLSDARTLVVHATHDKIFSNGIDLEWLVPIIQQGDISAAKDFFFLLNKLLLRLVSYPLVTIAAITGHAFAGGAIMACTFDFRLMRSDRGFLCLPEVDLGIPFLPGMNAILAKAIPHYKLEEMQYTGCRLTAEECVTHHIVYKACHISELLEETLTFARGLNKQRAIVQEMKRRLNRPVIQAIEVEDGPYIESGKFNIG
ncbi:MAG: enoyl-CoA hydratase/isomerase family protein [Desulfobacterales bacterium]|jgi:enoyl-CoA hydratase/carnithine racemase